MQQYTRQKEEEFTSHKKELVQLAQNKETGYAKKLQEEMVRPAFGAHQGFDRGKVVYSEGGPSAERPTLTGITNPYPVTTHASAS